MRIARYAAAAAALLALSSFGQIVSAAAAQPQTTPATAQIPALQAQAENYVRQRLLLGHRRLETLNFKEESVFTSPTTLEVVFMAHETSKFDFAKPEDVPALKAKRDFVTENAKNLTPAQLAVAQEDINVWTHELQGYIDNAADSNERIKVTAALDANQTINPASVQVMVETFKTYIPASQMLAQIPSLEQTAGQGRSDIAALVNNSSRSVAAATSEDGIVPMTGLYNRIAARDYVRTWATDSSTLCGDGSNTYSSPGTYNPSYAWYQCNDCANFVSQGMKAGGIPTDGTWAAGTTPWINVGELIKYMSGKGYIQSSAQSSTLAGHLVTLGSYHVMMVTLNDTVNFQVTGHTSDMVNRPYWNAADGAFYVVTY